MYLPSPIEGAPNKCGMADQTPKKTHLPTCAIEWSMPTKPEKKKRPLPRVAKPHLPPNPQTHLRSASGFPLPICHRRPAHGAAHGPRQPARPPTASSSPARRDHDPALPRTRLHDLQPAVISDPPQQQPWKRHWTHRQGAPQRVPCRADWRRKHRPQQIAPWSCSGRA